MSELAKSRGNFEEEFCGSLMIERYFKHYLAEGFSDELLTDNTAKYIWRWTREYYERSHAIPTLEVMSAEFPKYEFAMPNGEPHWLLEKLRENYTARQSRAISVKVAELTADKKHDEAFEYMKHRVFEREAVMRSETHSFGPHNIQSMMERYKDRLLAGAFEGATTGWPHVDEITGGFRKGTISLLLGRPKRQKTWFGLKAWVEQKRAGHNPILFTLEMSPDEIYERISALISGVSYNKITKGFVSMDELDVIMEAWDRLGGQGTYNFTRPPVGQRSVPQMMIEADRAEADSVIIDQFSFIEPRREKSEYRREDLWSAEIVYDLKAWSTRQGYEIPIYYMAQFNRQQEGQDELSAARAALTGALEQASDSIFGLYSNKELLENNQVKFVIMEGRAHESGPEFYVDYEFWKHTDISMAERGAFPVELTPDGKLLTT